MLTELLGQGVELAPLKRLIIERTEGNPFFMEETVQGLFEQGVLVLNSVTKLAKPLEQIRVPPTVRAVLASRIDRLPAAEKELLQTLAVLGREFSSGLIKHVVGKSDDELERILSALQVAEFIYEQPATVDVEYQFKTCADPGSHLQFHTRRAPSHLTRARSTGDRGAISRSAGGPPCRTGLSL
jgi:predicted ATPase